MLPIRSGTSWGTQHSSCHHSTVSHLVQTSVHHYCTSQMFIAYKAYCLYTAGFFTIHIYIYCIPVTVFFIIVQQIRLKMPFKITDSSIVWIESLLASNLYQTIHTTNMLYSMID